MTGFVAFWRDCRPGRVVHLCVLGGHCLTGRVLSRSPFCVRLIDHDGDHETARWWTIKAARHGATWEREFEAAQKIATGLREFRAKRQEPKLTPISDAEIEAMLARGQP